MSAFLRQLPILIETLSKSIFKAIRELVRRLWLEYVKIESSVLETVVDIGFSIIALRYFFALFAIFCIFIYLRWWLVLTIYVAVIAIAIYRFFDMPRTDTDTDEDVERHLKVRSKIIEFLRVPLRIILSLVFVSLTWHFDFSGISDIKNFQAKAGHPATAIALAIGILLGVSGTVWLFKKWRNRPEKEAPATATPAVVAKTPAAKDPTAPKNAAHAITDIRTYLALASVALLVTFNDTFFGEVIGVAYTTPTGQLYVPLAGLMYYTLGWVAAGLFMGVMEDTSEPLALVAGIGLGIATMVAGWANGWYRPFPVPHTVGHALGNIVFPADPLVPWWVVAAVIALLIMATRDVDMKYTIWTKMDFNVVILGISFCLFAPQVLPMIVSYIL